MVLDIERLLWSVWAECHKSHISHTIHLQYNNNKTQWIEHVFVMSYEDNEIK